MCEALPMVIKFKAPVLASLRVSGYRILLLIDQVLLHSSRCSSQVSAFLSDSPIISSLWSLLEKDYGSETALIKATAILLLTTLVLYKPRVSHW
jgi:hypothetical protein